MTNAKYMYTKKNMADSYIACAIVYMNIVCKWVN